MHYRIRALKQRAAYMHPVYLVALLKNMAKDFFLNVFLM